MLIGNYKILAILIITFFIAVNINQMQPLQQQQQRQNYRYFAQNSTQPLLSENVSNNNNNMASIIDKSLNRTLYSTFNNVTTPAVAVDPSNNALYVSYFKNESNGGNIYLQKSADLGKHFQN
jgi:hypothetical protein